MCELDGLDRQTDRRIQSRIYILYSRVFRARRCLPNKQGGREMRMLNLIPTSFPTKDRSSLLAYDCRWSEECSGCFLVENKVFAYILSSSREHESIC